MAEDVPYRLNSPPPADPVEPDPPKEPFSMRSWIKQNSDNPALVCVFIAAIATFMTAVGYATTSVVSFTDRGEPVTGGVRFVVSAFCGFVEVAGVGVIVMLLYMFASEMLATIAKRL